MTEPTDKSFETDNQTPDFQAQIDAVTNRVLTPENINTYADNALSDFVDIIESIKYSYDGSSLPLVLTDSGREMAMMQYYNIDPDLIETMLDHIADVASSIDELDSFIKNHLDEGSTVVTPPAAREQGVYAGDGSFQEKRQIPRLKTTLLLLKHRFGIDIDDKSQLKIIPGKVTPNMVRKLPYNMLDVPILNRMIDVCDEEGNRTFVFDRDKLLKLGLNAEAVAALKKPELEDLISRNQLVGESFNYNKVTFIETLARLLEDDFADQSLDTANPAQLLKRPESPPEGVINLQELAKNLGVNVSTIKNIIAGHTEQIGTVNRYRFGRNRNWGYGFSVNQQEVITHLLGAEGKLIEDMPEGFVSITHFRRDNKIDDKILEETIAHLEDEIGQVAVYRVGTRRNPAKCLNTTQQERVLAYLKERDYFNTPPEGVLSVPGLSKLLGLDHSTIMAALGNISEELGEVKKYKFGSNTVYGYDPDQQQKLKDYLSKKGTISEVIPDGVITVQEFADSVHLSRSYVHRVINTLGIKLQSYKFNEKGRPGFGMNEDEQAAVRGYIEKSVRKVAKQALEDNM